MEGSSHIAIDPAQRYGLKIIVTGQTGKFDMVNQTTGDEIVYVNSLQPNDQLVWDDMYCYLNGELCTDSTNLAWMRLAPGWNEFKIYGYNKVDIRFHFRFVYLN